MIAERVYSSKYFMLEWAILDIFISKGTYSETNAKTYFEGIGLKLYTFILIYKQKIIYIF